MNLVYGPVLHDSRAVDKVRPARYLGGHRFESCRELKIFPLSHARDMLIITSVTKKMNYVLT